MPFKSSAKKLEYQKEWRGNNKQYFRDWDSDNKEKRLGYIRRWRIKNKPYLAKKMAERREKLPWEKHFYAAKTRCTNPKCERYLRYGGRGINFNLSIKDVETLWERDNASQMNNPSIDRINNDGNYEFKNCRFIEMSENHKRRILQIRKANQ